MPLRSGFVSILGRPNAGKSTLVNALVGENVAIVTRKPQTTRNRIHGVLEVPALKGKHPAAQIVFVDTPGVHKPTNLLDKRMLQEVYAALESRNVVLHVVDVTRRSRLPATKPPAIPSAQPDDTHGKASGEMHGDAGDDAEDNAAGDAASGMQGTGADGAKPAARKRAEHSLDNEDAFLMELVKKLDCPVFLVLNKIDAIDAKEALLPLIAQFTALHDYAEVFPVSARGGDGLDRLIAKLVEYMPEGRRYFPKGQFTDQPERFLAAEIIREKILNLTGEEVPYASAVVIERFEERIPEFAKQKPLTRISAAIYCERSGQKAILIGKGGAMLKQIGIAARKSIEALLGMQVHLELFVKVADDWRGSGVFLDSLDWRRQLESLARLQQEASAEEEGKS